MSRGGGGGSGRRAETGHRVELEVENVAHRRGCGAGDSHMRPRTARMERGYSRPRGRWLDFPRAEESGNKLSSVLLHFAPAEATGQEGQSTRDPGYRQEEKHEPI